MRYLPLLLVLFASSAFAQVRLDPTVPVANVASANGMTTITNGGFSVVVPDSIAFFGLHNQQTLFANRNFVLVPSGLPTVANVGSLHSGSIIVNQDVNVFQTPIAQRVVVQRQVIQRQIVQPRRRLFGR